MSFCKTFKTSIILHFIVYMLLLFGNTNGKENGKIETNVIAGKELKVIIMKVCN